MNLIRRESSIVRYTKSTLALTHDAALAMLAAGVAKAEEIGQPQCLVIVDTSGVSLAELRMTGSKVLSLKSARAKARTAASLGAPSASIPEAVRTGIGLATEGAVTGLPGGLPIRIEGTLVGGIGVGSGSGTQDIAVAQAALAAVGAAPD
jgi:uncharacterized protein GlcG (DUF336 family)